MRFLSALIFSLFLTLIPIKGLSKTIELTKDNHVALQGRVTGKSMSQLSYDILNNPNDEIYLFIDSGGGSIFAGLRLIDVIRTTDKKVICIANMAISMAFVIFQACDERYVMPKAVLMQHVASYESRGNEPNNYSWAKFMRRTVKILVRDQAKRLGISAKKFAAKIRDDWWMIGHQSVYNNAADEVVDVKCSKKLAKAVTTRIVRSMFWSVKITTSNCPLISGPIKIKSKQLGGTLSIARRELSEVLDAVIPSRSLKHWKSAERGSIGSLTRIETVE